MTTDVISQEMRAAISSDRAKENTRQVLSRIQMRLSRAYATKSKQQAELSELHTALALNRTILAEIQSLVSQQETNASDLKIDYQTTLKEISALEEEGVTVPPVEQIEHKS